MAIQRFFHQLAGENAGGMPVIPAVSEINVRLASLRNRDALPDITCSGPKGIRHGKPVAAAVRNAQAVTQLGQLILVHQKV